MRSPSNKYYVGITNNIENRIRQHKQDQKDKNHLTIKKAIAKYGFENMNFTHIATAFSVEDAKELEKVLIEYYDSYNNGYNSTKGGDAITITSKIKEEDVDVIRDLLENTDRSLRSIAGEYGVDPTTIYFIQNGTTWSHIGNFRIIKRKKNSYAKGSNSKLAKLNEEQVYEIKRLYMEEDKKSPELAKLFNVDKVCICDIINQKTWTHVVYKGFKKKRHRGNSKFKESDIRKAWKLKLKGKTIKEIETQLGIPYATLYACFKGKNWKDLYKEYNK